MEDETYNVVDDTEVGNEAPQIEETEPTSEVTEPETPVTEPVVEPAPQQVQAPDLNAQFAAARRQAEAEARVLKAQNERLVKELSNFGYEGDPDSIADALQASRENIPIEQAKAQRVEQERQQAEQIKMQSELETYKNIAIQKLKDDDLKKIQAVYPEVKSLDELGQGFFNLLGATQDPILSYEAVKATKAKTTKATPPDMGAVNSNNQKDKDFYTSEEADKLTEKDYDNPKIFAAVRKSMTKW